MEKRFEFMENVSKAFNDCAGKIRRAARKSGFLVMITDEGLDTNNKPIEWAHGMLCLCGQEQAKRTRFYRELHATLVD